MQTKLAELDPLCDVSQDALEVYETLDVKDCKVVAPAHVVQVFLHALALKVAEQADAKRLECRLSRKSQLLCIAIFGHSKRLICVLDGLVDLAEEV